MQLFSEQVSVKVHVRLVDVSEEVCVADPYLILRWRIPVDYLKEKPQTVIDSFHDSACERFELSLR